MIRAQQEVKCPFKGCLTSCHNSNILRDHLLTNHLQSLHKLNTETWTNLKLHPCSLCNNQNIFKTKGYLNRHILQSHKKEDIGKDNITLLQEHIPLPPTSTPKWEKTLPWLHNLSITPPPFRQNIWHKTNKSAKNKIKFIYHKIILCITESSHKCNERPMIPHLHRREALWKLGLIFESLILHPIPKKSTEGTA